MSIYSRRWRKKHFPKLTRRQRAKLTDEDIEFVLGLRTKLTKIKERTARGAEV